MAVKKSEIVEIKPIIMNETIVTIVGDTPLIMHAWSEKAKKQMLDAQMGKAKGKQKEKKSPAQDFIDSLYWLTDKPVTVRAFVHVAESYRPTRVVLTEKSLSDELVERARQDMEAFRKRLLVFSSLHPVRDLITAIDDADQRLSEEACI